VLAATFAPGVFILILLVELALPIWSLVDASSRPDWAWQASGQNKTLWIVLNVVGLVFCGIIIGLIYLVAIRPKVAAAQRGADGLGGTYGGGYGGGYGSGPGYGGSSYGAPAAGGTGYGWTAPPVAPPPSGSPSATSAPPPPAPSVPAGWYPDPAGGGGLRYWNGTAWTEDVRPG
jgi:Protein of unknown function (DUF2510)